MTSLDIKGTACDFLKRETPVQEITTVCTELLQVVKKKKREKFFGQQHHVIASDILTYDRAVNHWSSSILKCGIFQYSRCVIYELNTLSCHFYPWSYRAIISNSQTKKCLRETWSLLWSWTIKDSIYICVDLILFVAAHGRGKVRFL